MRRAQESADLGGRRTSSGTEPLATTSEDVDDAVRRLVVERSHDLVTLCDPTGAIVYASPSWSTLGWEPTALAGIGVLEVIHPDDAAVATEAWNEVASGTDVDAVTIRLRRASGGYAWFEVNGSSVRTEDGKARFMLGTARDVSEREELRSRLRDLDAVYRVADAVAGAYVLDEVLEAALEALLEATGADRASVLLADDEGVMRFRAWRGLSDRYRAASEGHSPWRPDARDPQPVLFSDLAGAGFEPALGRAVRREGIGALAFVPLVRGDRLLGKFVLYRDAPHEWSDRELLLSRTIANHLASVIERTEAQQALHESGEQLATILRTVEEGITATSRDGRFLFANDAAARAAGLDSAEELMALSAEELLALFELSDSEGAPIGLEDLPAASALGGAESSSVVRLRRRSEDWERWLALRSTPVLGPGGAVELVVNVTRDITRETVAAQREAAARREAEASRARLALLLEATEQLSQTLDYEELLRRVPQLVVPRIADGCHIYVARGDRELVRVAHAHVDPRISALLDEIDDVYDTSRHRRIPVVEVFRSGEPIHLPSLDRPLKKVARPGEEELVHMESRSLVVVPLEAGGRRLGVLAVTSAEPGRHGDEDFELLSELARRISLALDLVDLHRRAQDSLAQLQAVIAQLPLGVAIIDADHRVVLRNEELERVWGAQIELGVDHRRSGPATDGWPLERAIETGEVTVGELRELERPDGSRMLEISAAPVRDAAGAIVSAVAIVADVTRRSHSEEQLRFLARANELFVASLDWEQTLAGIAELAVPALAGYLVIDLLDEDDELHWVVAVHADPEKTELVRELRASYPPTLSTHPIQVALRTGKPQLIPDLQAEAEAMAHDTKHARAIRRIANTSGIVAPLVARGRTLGAISLGTIAGQPRFDESDLEMATELARRISLALDNARLFAAAQERAHAAEALEYVDDGVILVDEAGLVRLWNPTAAMSLRRPAVEAVGRPIAELLDDWASLQSRIPVASEPQAGGASRAQTLPVDVHGEERWLSISAVRFPGGTVYAFRDVTDERAVEQMKTDFVSTVSHELRTPLAAIYGASVTLRRQDVTVEEAQRDRLLEVISSESDRLARIVNDILWASRLESGRMSVAIERCDAAGIAAEVADVARARAPEGVEVAVSASRGLPPVAADPDKLRQILTNLTDNAIKYSPDGGRVEVEISRSGGRVRFRVADQGLGVPPAEQDRIFEKFFRLDPNLTRGVGGTGLGLYISRELVTRMNGRIWVDSDGRNGSSFFLELPIA
ncbi:MAG TPA: GAF domain-containing protein [Gaiellaceae bacterium]|nr:GAF domain-containing protein [Gaiellaceae bacterium]